ncbi:MAG: polysaccharide deacetylase family protein [Candidatus Dormibacteraeota bacterium]|nr:polysaccharide deacetylase family protein [Candidatus Dormibacteraeota bacterium]
MLSRGSIKGLFRGALGDILNQVSYLTVVALCASVILLTGSHIGRHFRLVSGNPLAAFGGPSDPTAGLDSASRAESGLVPPAPVSAAPPEPQPVPESVAAPPLPTQYDLARPVHKGTWLPIVMYHYIRTVSKADRVGWNLSVSPENFRAQMRWLRDHGYTTLTMRDVDLVLAGKRPLPDRPVALTFDDAYRDFYTTAAPILRESGFTATNFVPTQLVGGNDYMSWREIEELDAEGFEMAAHTQYHVDISKTTPDRAKVEVYGAKADLESHLGHPVVDWAYPYGGVNAAAAQLVGSAGFWSAVTTQPGAWHDPEQLLYLSRVRMGGADNTTSISNGVTAPSTASPTAR